MTTTTTINTDTRLGRFNGTFTVTNTETGEHRTFRIKTQKPDAKFAPGQRILSMLTGPDNTRDFRGFAFFSSKGIFLWKRLATSEAWRGYAKLMRAVLLSPETATPDWLAKYHVAASTTCRVCNRKLTDPVSIQTGIGPVCAGRTGRQGHPTVDVEDETED